MTRNLGNLDRILWIAAPLKPAVMAWKYTLQGAFHRRMACRRSRHPDEHSWLLPRLSLNGSEDVQQTLTRRLLPPLFAEKFSLPDRSDITARLVVGSVLFGIGWGKAGLYSGPGVAALVIEPAPAATFPATMIAGIAFQLIHVAGGRFPRDARAAFLAVRKASSGPALARRRKVTRSFTLEMLANPDGRSVDERSSLAQGSGCHLGPLSGFFGNSLGKQGGTRW